MTYQLLKLIDDPDIPSLLSRYRCPSISRFISIDEKNYWRYVAKTPNVFFYKVYLNDVLVATTHLELAERVLYMDVAVFPEYQRRGIATNILKDIQGGKLGPDFDKIQVSIDEKNIASLKLFKNMGFACIGQDEELLDYMYIKS